MRQVGTTSGRSGARDPEQREQLVVPLQARRVEQQRARGVRDVGDVAAGERLREPAVDRAGGAARRARRGRARRRRCRAARRASWRRSTAAASVRCGAGRAPRRRPPRARAQVSAVRRVLPDEGRRDGPAGGAVPERRSSRAGSRSRRRRRAPGRRRESTSAAQVSGRREDLRRVVLDAAGSGVVLAMRDRRLGDPRRPVASTSAARVEVVPWSSARIRSGGTASFSQARRPGCADTRGGRQDAARVHVTEDTACRSARRTDSPRSQRIGSALAAEREAAVREPRRHEPRRRLQRAGHGRARPGPHARRPARRRRPAVARHPLRAPRAPPPPRGPRGQVAASSRPSLARNGARG